MAESGALPIPNLGLTMKEESVAARLIRPGGEAKECERMDRYRDREGPPSAGLVSGFLREQLAEPEGAGLTGGSV